MRLARYGGRALPATLVTLGGSGWCTAAMALPPHAPLDVVVLMDSSGSLSASDWAAEKAFVSRLNNGVPDRAQTRLGIVQFATPPSVERYPLTSSQVPSALDLSISNLVLTGGSTGTKDAANKAISMFDTESAAGNSQLIVLITDGLPNPSATQNPSSLSTTLQSRGIDVVVVGFGAGFSTSAYDAFSNGAQNIFTYPAAPTTADTDGFLVAASGHFLPEPGAISLLVCGAFLTLVPRRPRQDIKK